MILNDKDAISRLNSPLNLINQLKSNNKKNNAMSLFGMNKREVMSSGKDSNSSVPVITGEPHPVENTQLFNPFAASKSLLESPQTSLDNILENNESQIKLGLAHDKALDLLHRSVDALSNKLDDVRADRLPSVIAAASKTVESIRRERNEAAKSNKDREVHYHFYTPEQKKISDYEVIDVT